MQLSVIIVNYNVCYFLEQCLNTVLLATEDIAAEIIVVDNASSDDSRKRLPDLFPTVQFIWNAENTGFGKANNVGLAHAKGEFLALLNPDTLLPKKSFSTCLDFFATHPEAGGVGMRMFDGSGRYLPESKRGWPDVFTSFFKLTGISALFPSSRWLARYYLAHLDPDKINPVEVLAGAFMVIPRAVYDVVGGFDERFFMYGEDIDLSYRISKAGFINYYLPQPGIIHFKGESTIRDPANDRHFFDAMLLFVRKYYPGKAGWWKLLLEAAIYTRSVFHRPGNKPGSNKLSFPEISWQLIGDPGGIKEIEEMISSGSNHKKGMGKIFVLGSAYDLQQVMISWQQEGVPELMMFHATGSAGIVGSPDKNGRGEVIIL